MEMFGEAEYGVWTIVDGKAIVDGSELYIDGDGNLVMAEEGMVFTKAEAGATTGEMSDEELLMALLAAMAATEGEEGEAPAEDEEAEGEGEGEDEPKKTYVKKYETWFDFVFQEKIVDPYYLIFGDPNKVA
jgi:hypothetical protein